MLKEPIAVAEQGSFCFGGTVLTGASGDTFHGDHGYAQYQKPADARDLPILMWHGGSQSAKTWETTPSGAEGFDTIFLRRGFTVYKIDQPRRGRAAATTRGMTIPDAAPDAGGTGGDALSFNIYRLGTWTPPEPPRFFAGVQFAQEPDAIRQFFQQGTMNSGPEDWDDATRRFHSDTASALLDRIGAVVLLAHSNSGQYGWRTAMGDPRIRAICAYEPGTYAFPVSDPPADIATDDPFVRHITAPDLVPDDQFERLTSIPIQLVYGDNIERAVPSPIFGVELWRVNTRRAEQFAEAVNRRGGKVEIISLPGLGIHGNTHFPFADLNNLAVADQLSGFLARNGLDQRSNGDHHQG